MYVGMLFACTLLGITVAWVSHFGFGLSVWAAIGLWSASGTSTFLIGLLGAALIGSLRSAVDGGTPSPRAVRQPRPAALRRSAPPR